MSAVCCVLQEVCSLFLSNCEIATAFEVLIGKHYFVVVYTIFSMIKIVLCNTSVVSLCINGDM